MLLFRGFTKWNLSFRNKLDFDKIITFRWNVFGRHLKSIFTLDRHWRWRVLSPVIASVRPSIRLSVPNDVTTLNSLMNSAISLEFGGMMHSPMEQIAI